MADAISGEARRELVRAVGERYRAGTRVEKRRILDEFVAVTHWHRKHAIRTLNVEGSVECERRPRARVYDDAIRQALVRSGRRPIESAASAYGRSFRRSSRRSSGTATCSSTRP